MYYAPWCGHCKNLAPIWITLAEHVEGSDVLVAKIDMTANKVNFPEVQGYPTIYFYPKEGEPMKYESGRSLVDLKTFFVTNSEAYRAAFPEEGLPEPEPETNVKVLTTESHEKVTQDRSNDVLVMYYAPWCDHCNALKPVWE
jgi:protein disulfide-isomerase A6